MANDVTGRFNQDGAAQLGLADSPIDKSNWDFANSQPCRVKLPRCFDEKTVTDDFDAIEIEAFDCFATIASISRCAVSHW